MTKDVNLMPSATMQNGQKRKKIASLERRKARAGWLFVLPFIIGFVLIYLPMIYDSLVLTFNWEITKIVVDPVTGESTYMKELIWQGFGNYKNAFTLDNTFLQNLLTGLQDLAIDVPCILIFSLFMAIMLNQKMAGRAFFRAVFFVPVILATGIMGEFATVDEDMLGGIDTGAGDAAAGGAAAEGGLIEATDIQALFGNIPVGAELVTFITDLVNDIYNIVNRSGVQMLIFLAALQSISPAIYESCKIDGASAWETFWKITLPMLSPMILVNAVYTIIDSFTTSDNKMMTYIANAQGNMIYEGHGAEVTTAMSWVYFMVVILIVALISAICSAFVFYQRKSD